MKAKKWIIKITGNSKEESKKVNNSKDKFKPQISILEKWHKEQLTGLDINLENNGKGLVFPDFWISSTVFFLLFKILRTNIALSSF